MELPCGSYSALMGFRILQLEFTANVKFIRKMTSVEKITRGFVIKKKGPGL